MHIEFYITQATPRKWPANLNNIKAVVWMKRFLFCTKNLWHPGGILTSLITERNEGSSDPVFSFPVYPPPRYICLLIFYCMFPSLSLLLLFFSLTLSSRIMFKAQIFHESDELSSTSLLYLKGTLCFGLQNFLEINIKLVLQIPVWNGSQLNLWSTISHTFFSWIHAVSKIHLNRTYYSCL